jgi:hypothetical protein
LEECIAKLKVTTINEQKKKELNTTKVYDPNLAKIKKMENERKKEHDALTKIALLESRLESLAI